MVKPGQARVGNIRNILDKNLQKISQVFQIELVNVSDQILPDKLGFLDQIKVENYTFFSQLLKKVFPKIRKLIHSMLLKK